MSTVDVNIRGIQTLSFPTGVTSATVANGKVTINLASGSGISLQTNGVSNTNQAVLNLKSGTGITLTPDGVGGVTIDASGGGGGTVTTTGSPASGNLTKFSGTTSITNGDLSGDVATTGTLVTTIQANAVTTSKINNGAVTEAKITLANNTTNNVTSSAHGFAPIAPADATKFLNGAATPAYAQVKDSDLSLSNITTNDVSTSKHGFAPVLPNDATKFLNGTGAYSVPAGGGSTTTLATFKHTIIGYAYKFASPGAFGNTAEITVMGDAFNSSGMTPATTSTTDTATAAHGVSSLVHNTTANATGVQFGDAIARMGRNIQWWGDFYLPSTFATDTRSWWGLGGPNTGSAGNWVDDPTVISAAFRYSTIAGDTNFQCVTTDDSSGSAGHMTITNSGVAADANAHTFAIVINDSVPNVKFYIDGNLVATHTTHLPPSGTLMQWFYSVFSVAGTPNIGVTQFVMQMDH